MALSRLGVDLDASSSSSDDDEPIVTKKRTQSPTGFPKRFLADAYRGRPGREEAQSVEMWKSALALSSGEEPASPRHRAGIDAP